MFNRPILLAREHDLSCFESGSDPLNIYLKQYAFQNQKKDMGRTVIITEHNDNRVIGYYTLVTGSISIDVVSEKIRKGSGKYPIPVVVIARLAVDINYQGKGIGKALLKDALARILSASDHIGIRAVHVKAKDHKAVNFYKKFNFEQSPINELDLFLLLKDFKLTLFNQ